MNVSYIFAEKLTDSQINGLSSADNMLSADVMSDVGHSSISQKCRKPIQYIMKIRGQFETVFDFIFRIVS